LYAAKEEEEEEEEEEGNCSFLGIHLHIGGFLFSVFWKDAAYLGLFEPSSPFELGSETADIKRSVSFQATWYHDKAVCGPSIPSRR